MNGVCEGKGVSVFVGSGVFEGIGSDEIPGVLQDAEKTWIKMLDRIKVVIMRDLRNGLPPDEIIPALNPLGNPCLSQSTTRRMRTD